ncbi:hypothetical protein L1987_09385 [Smallanthus sonchifolius]|uniref:Uncharacterized protein n=1 Tax=Smallanthus sonchifolius TaxID=185202 RepID=A0ACB9JN92_9ASTR|nr:hypothetical protein L1987_09385 [Smallanthus sonchifolius]
MENVAKYHCNRSRERKHPSIFGGEDTSLDSGCRRRRGCLDMTSVHTCVFSIRASRSQWKYYASMIVSMSTPTCLFHNHIFDDIRFNANTQNVSVRVVGCTSGLETQILAPYGMAQ